MEDKAAVRLAVSKLRDGLTASEIEKRSAVIVKTVMTVPGWQEAEVIALYASFRSEVRTGSLASVAWELGKIVCFPRVKQLGGEFIFQRIQQLDQLTPGTWGIPEPPQSADVVEIEAIDVIVVPGLAFDHERARLGYGGGYYDRALVRLRPDALKVGLAFEAQIVPTLSTQPHDIEMDCVVTEERVI